MVETRRAHEDPRLRAEVIRRREMFYAAGADPDHDRPAHVRAASGCVAVDGRLILVQDDAAFFAVVDPASGLADAVPLPVPDGVRQFEKARGNKMSKPDLESVLAMGQRVLGIGSGSAPGRDRIAVLSPPGARGEARWFAAGELFRALAGCRDFAGSELNVEGAVALGHRVRLFNRGNGATRGDEAPCNAWVDVDRRAFERWIDGGAVPELGPVVRWDLGTVRGVRLTFTDAAIAPFGLAFVAAAEASPDAVEDGETVGVVLGGFDETSARWAAITEGGVPIADKVEGLAFDPIQPGRAWAVVDRDEPTAPALLLDLALSGPWDAR